MSKFVENGRQHLHKERSISDINFKRVGLSYNRGGETPPEIKTIYNQWGQFATKGDKLQPRPRKRTICNSQRESFFCRRPWGILDKAVAADVEAPAGLNTAPVCYNKSPVYYNVVPVY